MEIGSDNLSRENAADSAPTSESIFEKLKERHMPPSGAKKEILRLKNQLE